MSNKRRFDKRHCVLQKGEYQRSDGTYEYKWTDSFGKRHSIYSLDLDELRLKEQKIEINRFEGIKEAPATLTVEKLYETWEQLKRGIKARTHANYIYLFDSFIKPSFGKKRVVKVKRTDVRAFYISLLEERGVTMASVENVHNVLQQVFQYAVDDDIIRKNPCERVLRELKVTYGELKSTKKQSLTLEQEVNFLKFIYQDVRYQHWFPTFFIMANTGLRVGEFTGLRWKDIDLEKKTIDVNHTLAYFDHKDSKGIYYSINTPKTKNGNRKIVMTEAVKEAFILEKKYQEMIMTESVDEIDGYDDFVFVNRFGHVQHQGTLNKALRRIIRDYNLTVAEKTDFKPEDLLPHFSCHVLRHTYATRLIECGANVKFVQYQMGHSEIQTTYDIYVSVTENFKQKEIKSFEDYMTLALNVMPTIESD